MHSPSAVQALIESIKPNAHGWFFPSAIGRDEAENCNQQRSSSR